MLCIYFFFTAGRKEGFSSSEHFILFELVTFLFPCEEKHYSHLVNQTILHSFPFFSPRLRLCEKSYTRLNILINAGRNYYYGVGFYRLLTFLEGGVWGGSFLFIVRACVRASVCLSVCLSVRLVGISVRDTSFFKYHTGEDATKTLPTYKNPTHIEIKTAIFQGITL